MPLLPMIAAGAANTALGLMLEKHEDQRQLKQQDKLNDMQLGANMKLTEYNRMQQMKLWEDTNYKAQMEQLRKAGLNAGLIYGMSGGGGATTGLATGSVNAPHSVAGTGTAGMMAGMGLQLGLQKAQIDNINASTEKIKAEIPKTQAETASITQGINNQKAQEKLTWLDTELRSVEASVARQTIGEQMKAMENLVNKGLAEIRNLNANSTLTESETPLVLQNLKQDIAEKSVRMALMNKQKEVADQNIKNMIQEILESQQRIKTMAGQLQLNWMHEERLPNQNESTEGANSDWNFIKDYLPTFLLPIGKGFGGGHTPIRGFNK